jgi:hypothetical protein
LANIAIDYACGDQMPKSGILDELDQRNSFKLKTELKYLHLGKINVMARLDSEIEMLSRQISRMKKGSIVAGSMELVFPSLRELLGPNTELALAERDGQIANLNQTVAERDGQIASLNQAVAERDMQIAALYHSTSWRITWPLRIIGRQLKRFRREGLAGQLV